MVTKENYEEYMMLAADGELDDAGKEALSAFIAANPALESELAAWKALKMEPDERLVYTGKETLIRKEKKAIILAWNPRSIAVAAAVVGLLFMIPVIWRTSQREPIVTQRILPQNHPVAMPVRIHDSSSQAVVASIDDPVKRNHVIHSNKGTRHAQVAPQSFVRDSFIVLHAVSVTALTTQISENAPQMQQQPVTIEAVTAPKHHESGLPRIVLADENKPAINLLKRALDERVAQAGSAAKAIKETALVVRIGHGSVNLNF